MKTLIPLLLAAAATLSTPANAEGSTCASNLSPIEKAICLNAEFVKQEADMAPNAQQLIQVTVDISDQTMEVQVNSTHYASWKVSTARPGYHTPRGRFTARTKELMHYSKKYDNAPMPHSVFFHGGYAIHATDAVKNLGRPASHGCVRLSPDHAAELYALVSEIGLKNTRIILAD